MTDLIPSILFVGKGIILTFQLLLGGIAIGICLGTLFSILRYKNIGAPIIGLLISIIRGTPLILQLSLVYFALPSLVNFKLNILSAGIITFGLNSSAYISEILRSGIESIDKGQFEAAKVLEIPSYNIWKDIILPQAVKNILPSLISEVITLLKETALIGTIGGLDTMRMAQMLGAEQFTYFLPLCIAATYYYVIVLIIERLGKKIAKKNTYVKN